MRDSQLWEELTSFLIKNTKMRGHTIGAIATMLMPLLLDGARYRWIAADPGRRGALQWCEGKEEMDRHIDTERAGRQSE